MEIDTRHKKLHESQNWLYSEFFAVEADDEFHCQVDQKRREPDTGFSREVFTKR